jgi:hypothetical protein
MSTASYYIFTPNTVQRGCTWQFTGTVKDSATPSETSASTTANIIAIAFSGTITYNSPTIQSYNGSNKVKVIFNVSAGTAPFTFNIIVYNSSNQIVAENSLSSNNENVILATNTLPIGSYTINSIMSNSGVNIYATNSLIIGKAIPSITLPNFPANFIYNGNPATITANIISVNNQLTANDFVNNSPINSFTSSNIISVASAGTYIIVANTLGNGNYFPASVTNTLVISSNSLLAPSYVFSNSSGVAGRNSNGQYVSPYYTRDTFSFTGTETLNNQSAWKLYVNGVLYATTSSSASWSTQGIPGTYTLTFLNSGNANYTGNSITETLIVLQPASGSITSQPKQIKHPAQKHIVNISTPRFHAFLNISTQPLILNYSNEYIILKLTSNSSQRINSNISIVNVTSLVKNITSKNYTKLTAFNFSEKEFANETEKINVTATYKYNCNLANVMAFMLVNGSWTKLNYIENKSACTLSFAVPIKPVIGIFSYVPSVSLPSTTVSASNTVSALKNTSSTASINAVAITSTIPLSSVASTVTSAAAAKSSQNKNIVFIIAIVVAIALAISATVYLLKSKKKRTKRTSQKTGR